MSGDLKAELSKQIHRPASWLLLAIAVGLSLTFGYLVPSAAPDPARGQSALLPGAFVGSAIGGLPIFIGALALIFGVLVAGSEYGWDTWKTVLAQGPSRFSVYRAKIAAVAIGTAVLVLTLFVAAAGASTLVALLRDQPMEWPSLVDIARGFGAGWLIATMWGTFGVALAIVFRSVAMPIGLGLVWLLAVQNLLASLAAPVIPWIAEAQKGLPGPNAGSLVAGLGASATAPGVDQLVGTGQASLVVAAYVVAFAALGGWLLHRRDLG